MSIVKSAQLLNVGRCEGGLPMATFERLEPYVGKPTSPVLMGLGYGNVCAMMAWRLCINMPAGF